MKVLIITNGELGDIDCLKKKIDDVDYIIACDGGTEHLKSLNLQPNLILGDFDSLDSQVLKYYKDIGIPIERYPAEKDKTDTHIAVDKAVDLGADEVYILGALGTRFDHSYANIMLLMYLANKDIKAEIVDCHNIIRVYNKSFVLTGEPGQTVSLLPLGDDCIVESTKGLKYDVRDMRFPQDFPLGVSNVLTAKEATVNIKSGWFMVIMAQD